jgi:hypothetical protein
MAKPAIERGSGAGGIACPSEELGDLKQRAGPPDRRVGVQVESIAVRRALLQSESAACNLGTS